jgi:Zinc dependent phospholipase C
MEKLPGNYIHMESAKRVIDRLRAGDIPSDFPVDINQAKQLGEIAHKWRNYLAAGAIGPDIFFLLPDFLHIDGNAILVIVKWVSEVWEYIDSTIIEKWEKWVTPGVLDEITGGLLGEIGQFLQTLSSTILDAILDLVAQLWDWFGLLTSGLPQGYADNAFFWSDMFHYRRTYQFARQLFKNASTASEKSEQLQAFALGWMSHCATDVTGHSFVNAKCGGPFRLHWQRHHLVENHMDALVYDTQHKSVEPFGEYDTSCLHFRIAFRGGRLEPYIGTEDAPAYDYFSDNYGIPPENQYPLGESENDIFIRKKFFDLDTADLPEEVCNLIIQTMRDIFDDMEPKIMTTFDDEFHDGTSGRPSVEVIQTTFGFLYDFIKFSTTGGYSPPRPTSPDLFGDHSPPLTPGTDGGVSDDPARGANPGSDDDDSWSFWDFLFALFGWAKYIFDFGVWLATLPLAILNDILTYPLREIIYEYLVVPMWSLYIAARAPLVKEGFLYPKHEEIIRGLVELGISSTGPQQDLAAQLVSPDGTGTAPPNGFDEKSGRISMSDAFGADPAYPRAIIKDSPNFIQSILKYILDSNGRQICGQPKAPSEFLRPWKYPDNNNAGVINGWEAGLSHPGPFLQGQNANILMNNFPGDQSARSAFEGAQNPLETESACDLHLPNQKHLGDPVDYGVYLMGRLITDMNIPDFNLDSDRGYGYLCWGWIRDHQNPSSDRFWDAADNKSDPKSSATSTFDFKEPCTVPESFCQGLGTPINPSYNPNTYLEIYYLRQTNPPFCGTTNPHGTVTPQDRDRAKIPPEGGSE